MNTDQWIDKLNWRYATKQFDPTQKIDSETWAKVEESLLLTPSSFGLQPWKFIVVTDEAVKQALLPHSWSQQQVVDCSHLVVLAARSPISEAEVNEFIELTASTRGTTPEALEGYKALMLGFFARMDDEVRTTWAKNQVYVALGQLMATAAVIGIDACPMEGIVQAEYDTILNLEEQGYTTVVACPMGFRSTQDKYAELAKVRYTADKMIQHV